MYCTVTAFLPQNLQEVFPDEGVFLGGLLSVQVPSLIFLSLVSFFRCATESFLACRPMVEIPSVRLSSPRKQWLTFGLTVTSLQNYLLLV
jgi:hypothetical protein